MRSYVEGRTRIDGVPQEGTEEDIWTKWEEETGDWRKGHTQKLHNLFFSSNTIRVIKSRQTMCQRYAAQTRQTSNAYKVSVKKPEGKRKLARPRHRGE